MLDIKIILKTALKVLKRDGVTVRGTAKIKDYGPYAILEEEKNGGSKEADMTYSEIGSYFWLNDQESNSHIYNIEWLPNVEDSSLTFSGRNAIDIALKDILRNKIIQKAFVPSYCCISMLQAFIDQGIETEFYEVGYEDGEFIYDIPKVTEDSVVLTMSYFGLNSQKEVELITKIHEEGAIVIEDITHSLLRETPFSEKSDYLVASLRKWFAIPTGGWVGKRKGELSPKPYLDSNHAVKEKILGMIEKREYIEGRTHSKENYLLAQSKFDNDLIHVDRLLKIDDTSLNILTRTDVSNIISRRKKNVAVLLEGLHKMEGIISLPKVDLSKDVPLFLPIFMEKKKRDSLRIHLVEKGLYCPIHWPEVMGATPGLRTKELSLICDQRYSEGDMKAIIDAIYEWHKSQQSKKDDTKRDLQG